MQKEIPYNFCRKGKCNNNTKQIFFTFFQLPKSMSFVFKNIHNPVKHFQINGVKIHKLYAIRNYRNRRNYIKGS